MDSLFQYELAPFPMSLFKNNQLRDGNKHKLKELLLKDVSPVSSSTIIKSRKTVVDGGALLWAVDCRKGEQYESIFSKYLSKCKAVKADVVVFDGYESSTKSQAQCKRSMKTVQKMVIQKEKTHCPCDRSTFMSNYENKASFI